MRQAEREKKNKANLYSIVQWIGWCMQTLPLPLSKPLHRFNYVERSIHKYSDGFAIDTRNFFLLLLLLLLLLVSFESIIAHYFGIQLI